MCCGSSGFWKLQMSPWNGLLKQSNISKVQIISDSAGYRLDWLGCVTTPESASQTGLIHHLAALFLLHRRIQRCLHQLELVLILEYLRGYCTSGPYFWRFCAFSQKIKQPRTKYPMDLVRNVPRNSKFTILLQCRPLLWSYSEKCAKINIFHALSHKSITTWVSETPVQ